MIRIATFLCSIFILFNLSGHAQDSTLHLAKPVKTIQTEPIRTVSVDPYFNFYIATEKGNISKYDAEGNYMVTFSPTKNSEVTLLEAWRNVNIFVFYRNFQEYLFLNRFLTESPNLRFHRETAGFIRMATPSADNNLWIIDDRDFSLKKINLKLNQIEYQNTLDMVLNPNQYDLNFMREHQNLLFINDKNSGILIFDNMVNYKSKLPFKGIEYFNFFNNYIYFLHNNKLVFYHIYKHKSYELLLPEGKYNFALASENKVALFSNNFIYLYNIRMPAEK
ncbi:MAG: hypothetical protein ACK40G_06580 [Cytophagaceae bacterium]